MRLSSSASHRKLTLIETPHRPRMSLKAQPSHLFPKGRTGDAEQGGGFPDLTIGLGYRLLYVPTFGPFARLGETCDPLSRLIEQHLFWEDRLSRYLRRVGRQAERTLEPVAQFADIPRPTMVAQGRSRSRCQGWYPMARAAGELRKIVLRKRNDVLTPRPQRRDMESITFNR